MLGRVADRPWWQTCDAYGHALLGDLAWGTARAPMHKRLCCQGFLGQLSRVERQAGDRFCWEARGKQTVDTTPRRSTEDQ